MRSGSNRISFSLCYLIDTLLDNVLGVFDRYIYSLVVISCKLRETYERLAVVIGFKTYKDISVIVDNSIVACLFIHVEYRTRISRELDLSAVKKCCRINRFIAALIVDRSYMDLSVFAILRVISVDVSAELEIDSFIRNIKDKTVLADLLLNAFRNESGIYGILKHVTEHLGKHPSELCIGIHLENLVFGITFLINGTERRSRSN